MAATPAAAQDGATAIDEIVVVAQKREENLQDVPLSVSAMSGAQLEQIFTGGGDVLQLAGRSPGLNIESSNGRAAPRFYIRGLGNTDFDLAASQPVSVIFDDIVMENVALKSFPIFDVNQVEVSRGPQGTLFGRNTPAGIVHIRSNRPTDTFEANVTGSYGSFSTANFEGAVSGPITDTLSARGALLVQHRDDWIDNTFNGREIGGYDEVAGRIQVLFEPNDDFSALLNLSGRSLDGSSTMFRGNLFTPGTNEIAPGFDRERIAINAGNDNVQAYTTYGSALTLTYDFGGATLTSITGHETAEGRSSGDIDGTAVGGDATEDALDNLNQFTQELRLASNGDGPFSWQVGAFYFDGDFQVTTSVPGIVTLGTVQHENTSWAVFGQGSYDLTDQLTLTAGLRYTDDDKNFRAPLASFAQPPISLNDSQTTWDVTLAYEATPDLNIYGRVATGFRAPSIQGRNVGFGAPASTANSETVLSYEIGVKAEVLDGTGRINGAVYSYTIEDQQFTAVGGAFNSIQLVNADEGEGYGFELEADFDVTERLSVNAGFAWNHTEIKDPALRVAICATCTVLDPIAGGFALADGNPFPNAPEFTADLGATYTRPWGDGGQFVASTDWTFRGETNFLLYESIEFQTDVQFEGGLSLGYARTDGSWEAAIFARNITDEENVVGAIDFINLTGFVNEPRVIGVSLSARY